MRMVYLRVMFVDDPFYIWFHISEQQSQIFDLIDNSNDDMQ